MEGVEIPQLRNYSHIDDPIFSNYSVEDSTVNFYYEESDKRTTRASFNYEPPAVDLQFIHLNINGLSIGTTIMPEFSNLAGLLGGMLLHTAVIDHNLNMVENLIDIGVDLNVEDNEGLTPLYKALKSVNNETAKMLVHAGAKYDGVSSTGNTMIHNAVIKGDLDVLQSLIKLGAQVDALNSDGVTPLYKAAETSNQAAIDALIIGNADIDFKSQHGRSLLQIAVHRGRLDVVKQLIQLGASLNTCEDNGATALYTAMLLNYPGIIRILLDKGANASHTAPNGNSLLHMAVIEGSSEIVQKLVAVGADTNARNSNNETALCLAIKTNKIDVIKAMMSSNVDISANSCRNGDAPLHVAVSSGSIQCLQILVDNKADNSVLNADGLTPLALAIFLNFPDKINVLYTAFPVVNYFIGKNRNTPLHLAVLKADLLAAEKLLKLGARIDSLNGEGLTPLCKAIQTSDKNMIKLLVKNGANVNYKIGSGDTPLHFAISNGTISGVVVLIELGAGLNLVDRKGYTPLCKAIEMNLTNMINALLVKGANVSANCNGASPILLTISNSSLTVMKRLINLGAQLNQTNPFIMDRAIEADNLEVMKYFLKYFSSKDYGKLLLLAAQYGSTAAVTELLKLGAPISVEDSGFDPLWYATMKKKPKVMEVLINNGASVSKTVNYTVEGLEFYEWTLLHEAAYSGSLEATQVLVKFNVSLNARDVRRWTPLHYAAAQHHVPVIKELIKSGANVKARTKLGELPVDLVKRRRTYEPFVITWLTTGDTS